MRDGIHVRYTGDGVREVKGLGVFQRGTVAWAPRAIAVQLLSEECFEAASDGKPVRGVVVRIGQKPSHGENPAVVGPAPDLPDVPADQRGDIEAALEEEERRASAGDEESGSA